LTENEKNCACRLLIENIRVSVDATEEEILREAEKKLKSVCKAGDVLHMALHKKSIDARRREIAFVCSVAAELAEIPACDSAHLAASSIKIAPREELEIPRGTEPMRTRPVIVGFGPAGIFCGLLLAECGLRPLILEQGGDIEQRMQRTEQFLRGGALDTSTNIQFGAGGAGTFSDGKLTTRIGDSRCGYVLRRLVEFGAPEDILWRAKPHVGTDILRGVIQAADRYIRALGGEIRYNTKAERISADSLYADGERIPFDALVIACGHSARDLYGELLNSGFTVVPKAYSAGVRIEHLQQDIDRALYGSYAGRYGLSHGEYAVSHRVGERGVYSFCMCPGGEVVAAASELGGVVTNGMSYHARAGRNANAAIAVSVHPADYGNTPEGAIAFQRQLEQAAFTAGGGTYAAPCQTMGDFLSGKKGTAARRVLPTYRGGDVVLRDFHDILPPFITSMLATGFGAFGKKIRGFDAPEAVLTGVETRTSAPVRILRQDETLTAPGYPRIYPCGEGAGYAGGIMSAAVDGIRVAQAILRRFERP